MLVIDMPRDAELALLMHFFRTDLDLHRLFRDATQRINNSVNRAITVLLRGTDIIFEFTGDWVEDSMDDAEGAVTVFHALNNQTKGETIRQLLEAPVLEHYLTVRGIETLDPVTQATRDTMPSESLHEESFGVLHANDVKGVKNLHFPFQIMRDFRLKKTEASFLHFVPPRMHPKPSCDTRIHVECFVGYCLLESWIEQIEVAHIIETMCHSENNEMFVSRKCVDSTVKVFGVRIDVKPS